MRIRVFAKLIIFVLVLAVLPLFDALASVSIPEWHTRAAAASFDDDSWLEPRGLNIVDLVGQVPEEHLRDAIVSFVGGAGISQYASGIRTGDIVTVTYHVTPNYQSITTPVTHMSCPSYQGFSDHWPVPMPQAHARFFAGSEEITGLIFALQYHPSGLFKPAFGATTDRYPRTTASPLIFSEDGAIEVPANMGCTLFFLGTHTDVRAVYVYEQPQMVRIQLLGADTFTFQSYIGPGEGGWLTALQQQMSQFGDRHDKFFLSPPSGTDYIFVNYPPTPVGPYVAGDIETNIRLPSSGTYRLASGIVKLSSDHYVSFAMPVQGQWQDADQAGFLYLSRLTDINVLTAPEYFVPVGVEYDPCMRYGGCSMELLERIYNTSMQLSILYMSVERVVPDLQRFPLRQVGPGWHADMLASTSGSPLLNGDPATIDPPPHRVYLPFVGIDYRPAHINAICPCGWFDSNGRMFDFTPRPE